MSSKIRFAAALLIVSSMACGSLSAFPLGHRAVPLEEGGPTLTALVDWVASLFSWGGPHGKVPKPPRTKIAAQIDPDGSH